MNKTIQQIKERKTTLEYNILELLANFSRDTGVYVDRIDFDINDARSIDTPGLWMYSTITTNLVVK